jgi:ribosomal protein S18 acetylase RimI-like enzyme
VSDEDVTIRPAAAEDAPRLGELAGRLVRMHHEADPARFFLVPGIEAGYGGWLGREMRRDGAVVIVAVRGGKIVGYAYGTLEPVSWNDLLDEHGELHDVFVDDASRRAGVGGRLLDAALAALEAKGARRVVLSTMVANHAAQRLFASRGFRPTMLEMTRGG